MSPALAAAPVLSHKLLLQQPRTSVSSTITDGTVGYPSFGPTAQCAVQELKGLACRARVSLRLARLSCTASSAQRSRCLCSARAAAPVLLAHAEVTKIIICFPMAPKLRYPMVLVVQLVCDAALLLLTLDSGKLSSLQLSTYRRKVNFFQVR